MPTTLALFIPSGHSRKMLCRICNRVIDCRGLASHGLAHDRKGSTVWIDGRRWMIDVGMESIFGSGGLGRYTFRIKRVSAPPHRAMR